MRDLGREKLAEIYLADGGSLIEQVGQVVLPHVREAVNVFYSELLANPEAEIFLNEEKVAVRLTEALRGWLEDLFSPKSERDIEPLLERQRQIGRMHARINVPVHLVVEGIRILRRELSARMRESNLARDDLVRGIVVVNELIDHIVSLMNESYIGDVVSDQRNIQSLQVHLSPQTLALELERLRAAAFAWLAETTVALHNGNGTTHCQVTPLRNKDVGLWLAHKAPLLSGDRHNLEEIDAAINRTDLALDAAIEARSRDGQGLDSAIQALHQETSRLAWLLAQRAVDSLDLESGRDPLTHLFNRRFLPTILKHETAISIRLNNPFGTILFDIDHFKKINDTYGHDAGDAVLMQFAEILVENVRGNDFVFRYGGEEYLIVLGDADEAISQQVAEKIRLAVERHAFDIGGGTTITATTSAGIAVHDGNPDYLRTLSRADEALYQAKHAGRNRSVVAPRLERRAIV